MLSFLAILFGIVCLKDSKCITSSRASFIPRAAVRRYFSKYMLFKISEYSQTNTFVGVPF